MTKVFKAKTIEEAKALASKEFGVNASEISFQVINEGKKGFLGFGQVDAEIKASYMPPKPVSNEQIKKVEPVAEPVKKAEPVAEPVEKTEPIAEPVEKAEPISQPVEKTEPIAEPVEKTEPISQPVEKNAVSSKIDEYSIENYTLIDDESLLDERVVCSRDYIIDVLKAMEIEATATIFQNENGAIINLDSANNGAIIGRRGETLDSIQYLASMICNKGDKEYFRITVDCFGYRAKRKITLEQLANKVAQNVLKTGRSQSLEPMNPYERRVIHSVVSELQGVVSRSVGEEPYRKIVVSSTTPRKRNNDNRRRNNNPNHRENNRNRNNNSRPARNNKPENPVETKAIDLSTSFEKDYKKPKPEDSIKGGLYGKIEF